MKIVAISDTHLTHEKADLKIPDGDILIHSGDATFGGRPHEIYRFAKWFAKLPHKHKIFVAGNHDFGFQTNRERAVNLLFGIDSEYYAEPAYNGIVYLEDSATEIDGIKIYGSPWQPWFYDWAFNLQRGAEIKEKWDMIPAGIDILVTHGPPAGYGDVCPDGRAVGCVDLMNAIERVKPKYHICGHIHHSYGTYETKVGTKIVNASICDEAYAPTNAPIVFEL